MKFGKRVIASLVTDEAGFDIRNESQVIRSDDAIGVNGFLVG